MYACCPNAEHACTGTRAYVVTRMIAATWHAMLYLIYGGVTGMVHCCFADGIVTGGVAV